METKRRLGAAALLSYCMYAIPLTAVTIATTSFIPAFYSEVHGLSLTAIGVIFLVLRIFDAVTDPLMGMAVDRSPFRQQHKPWIMIAFPIFVVSVALLFMPIPALVNNAYFFISGFLVYAAYTIALVAHQAWGASLAPDPKTVSRLFAVREIFVIAGILATFIVAAVAEQVSGGGLDIKARAAGTFILVAFVVGTLTTVLFAPDDQRIAVQKNTLFSEQKTFLFNRNFILLASVALFLNFAFVASSVVSYFVAAYLFDMGGRYALGLVVYFVGAGLGMPLWMWIASRLGDRRTMLLATGYAIVAYLSLLFWAQLGTPAAYFSNIVLSGAAFGAFPFLIRSMVGNAANRFEKKSGHRVRGISYSVLTFFDKVGTGLAAGIVLPLVTWLGFNPASVNPADHANIILWVGALIPAIAFLVMGGVLALVAPSFIDPHAGHDGHSTVA